ncbi:MAG: DUF4338 domain-containing protein [Candidatus Aenigmarchaeota archaeon]|nr:DUF4338 domain-containing protein [Candidatus Aenigmarchaeota archaeon]
MTAKKQIKENNRKIEDNKPSLSKENKELMRKNLMKNLRCQGFSIVKNTLVFDSSSKENLRKLNSHSVEFVLEKNKWLIDKYDDTFLKKYIVDGKSLDPKNIEARIVQVEDDYHAALFRWIKLHWSIPISAGYGRRLRYIVFDDTNGGVIGIIGLGDPVYSLTDRDNLIGWSPGQKSTKLKHLMDAFVLGSVPPYNMVLGGKLVASLVGSKEVFNDFKKKYGGKKSLIRGECFDGNLVAVTTASALGKSSLYDRIKIPGGPEFMHIGWTRGSGEFHFMNGYYEKLSGIVKSSGYTGKNKKWGSGFRSRRVVVRKALSLLELPTKFQYHGIKREIFMAPLGENWKDFLLEKHKRFKPYDMPVADISEYMKERWMIPRSQRYNNYKFFNSSSYSLGKINL